MCAAADHVGAVSELVDLLKEYQWIWDIKMTELITRQHWTHLPDEWSSVLVGDLLKQLPDGYTQSDWPNSLRSFVTRCHRLKLETTPPEWVCQGAVSVGDRSRLKPKKLHEVSRLAGVIQQVCDRNGCGLVIDIGSGLGYLGRAVTAHSARKVIGIERDEQRVTAAQHIKPGCGQVTSIAMAVEWSPRLPSSILSLLADEQCALLTGLHCCGDLTPTALRLFSSLPSLTAMIIVPCCYHKMAAGSFPLSRTVTDLLTVHQLHITSYGMRLAAQESAACWQSRSIEQQHDQCRHVLHRAILESVLADDSLGLSAQQVARAVRGISHVNIAVFIEQLLAALASTLPVESLEWLRAQLLQRHSLYQHHIKFIHVFTALQACLQRPMESLILLDHLLFIREREGITAQLVPVFDEAVSPRCIAILAHYQTVL